MTATIPDATVARRRRNREETRRALVEAAFRLFSKGGFARTSVRDIAAEVGVTDAALYHHFASKKELLDAVFEERGVKAWAERIEQMGRTTSVATALERSAVAGLQFIEQHRDLFRLVLIESLAGDAAALAHHAGQMALWQRGLASLIAKGEPSPGAEPEELADHLVAALWGIAVERLLGSDPEPLIDAAGHPTPRCRDLARRTVHHVMGDGPPETAPPRPPILGGARSYGAARTVQPDRSPPKIGEPGGPSPERHLP